MATASPAPPPTPPRPEIPRVETVPRRVLVRLPNWLGDVVLCAPAVAAIHERHPAAELVAQAKPALLGLAAHLPGVRETLPAGADRGPRTLWASRRRLRAAGLDAAVVFPRSLRAMLAPYLAGIPVRVGFGGPGRRRLLTHGVEGWRPWRDEHRSRYFALLAGAFGAEAEARSWALTPPKAALERADALLRALGRRRERPLAVLEPGSAYGPAKCWPAARFGALSSRLLETGFDVACVGTAPTRPHEDVVAAASGGRLLRAVGRTPDLAVLAALLARADVVVANDTGPMHLAAAVGTPTLALFGATDPVVSAPRGPGRRRLLYEPEPCSPCFLRRCPVPGHPCLERFGVERVLTETLDLLGSGAQTRAADGPGALGTGWAHGTVPSEAPEAPRPRDDGGER